MSGTIYVKFSEEEVTGWWATVRVRELGATAPPDVRVPPHGPWATLEKAKERMGLLINLSHRDVVTTVEPAVRASRQRTRRAEAALA